MKIITGEKERILFIEEADMAGGIVPPDFTPTIIYFPAQYHERQIRRTLANIGKKNERLADELHEVLTAMGDLTNKVHTY